MGLDAVQGRGPPRRDPIMLQPAVVVPLPERGVAAGKDGVFSTSLQVPVDLPYGMFTIEAVAEPEGKVLAAAEFIKSYSDEPERDDSPR